MGVPFCLSTVSLCSLEEVQKATGAPFWFQLYMLKDRGMVAELLQRAKASGCSALVVTADLSQVGVRYSDIRNGVGMKSTLRSTLKRALSIAASPAWAKDVALGGRPLVFGNLAQYAPSAKNPENLKAWAAAQFDPSMHWKDLDWVRSKWDGPIVLKGVLEPDDAVWAASAGVQAVVVSNHGGRQLDCASATARALPRIAQATKGAIELWVDGGLRFGHDVIKAIALGATGTLIGRPWAWALAAGGQSGVEDALTMMETEIKVSLGLTGYRSLSELTLDSLVPLFPGVFGPTEHNGRLT
jgi:L-lactate dehydrogenase (cytochrome)